MKEIKICFVAREYAHPQMGTTGGIGVFLKQFTEQLKHHHFKIIVFSFGSNSIRFHDSGVEVVKIKDLSSINEWLKAPLRRYKVPGYITIKLILEFVNRLYISLYLSIFVARHHFDLIEFHDYGGDAPYFLGRLPKVVRCHGSALTLHRYMGYVNRIADSIFEKQFFRRFHNHVIAVSQYSAETTQEAFHLKNKPKVIYNGVEIPDLVKRRLYLNAPTLPYSIYYFGSIRERKGIDITCAIFNEVIETFPKASFHVMGNNNNDHWNQVAVNILSPKALAKTKYYGSIPNADIALYLEKAHVVLFPSYGENFSIALLEVMALGKIVIASDIPAFKEIIDNQANGIIASDEPSYVEWIRWVFMHPKALERLSENARSTIQARFDLNTIIPQNIHFYKSVLKHES